jgi:hypothetical protein
MREVSCNAKPSSVWLPLPMFCSTPAALRWSLIPWTERRSARASTTKFGEVAVQPA